MAVVFIGAGVLCLVLGITHLHKLNSGSYIETEAEITKIDETEEWDSDTDTYRKSYVLTVQYSVDGKTYVLPPSGHFARRPGYLLQYSILVDGRRDRRDPHGTRHEHQ